MEKVHFNEVEIFNWMDYLKLKFADNRYFEINVQNSNVVIKSKTNNTEILFYDIGDEVSYQLSDCQYTNMDCKGWSGESCAIDSDKYGTFTQDNLNSINTFLEVPINEGWISVDYYFMGEVYKAISFTKDKSKKILTYWPNGCTTFLFLPVIWILKPLIEMQLIGRKQEFIVEPICKNTGASANSRSHSIACPS